MHATKFEAPANTVLRRWFPYRWVRYLRWEASRCLVFAGRAIAGVIWEAAHLGHRFAQLVDDRLPESGAVFGVGAEWIADHPGWAEVVRKPSETDCAAPLHEPVFGYGRRHVRHRLGHVDEIAAQVQQNRCLVVATVDAHAQLARPPCVLEGMGQKRSEPVGETQVATRHLEKRRVSAVGVDEYQCARRGGEQRPADVVEDGEHRRGRQPNRAGGPGVLVRLGKCQGRQRPQIVLVAEAGHERVHRRGRDDQVGREGQVRAVSLDRAHRQHDD